MGQKKANGEENHDMAEKDLNTEAYNIDTSLLADRNNLMVYKYLFEGTKQVELAKEFNISQPHVSQVIQKVLSDEGIKNKLYHLWEKEYSIEARKKALELIRKIDPDKHPPSKRAVDSATLVDKARLIDGERPTDAGFQITEEEAEFLQGECVWFSRRSIRMPNPVKSAEE